VFQEQWLPEYITCLHEEEWLLILHPHEERMPLLLQFHMDQFLSLVPMLLLLLLLHADLLLLMLSQIEMWIAC
jgi:hypothetical protein